MSIQNHPVVSREEWLVARQHHLAHEKAFTRERDKLSAERRALPWVKIDKDYRFQGPGGELKLADLFGGRSQLVIYHFMFAEGWDEGCPGCSFLSDHIDGANQHLATAVWGLLLITVDKVSHDSLLSRIVQAVAQAQADTAQARAQVLPQGGIHVAFGRQQPALFQHGRRWR